jgi:hypothetical protein
MSRRARTSAGSRPIRLLRHLHPGGWSDQPPGTVPQLWPPQTADQLTLRASPGRRVRLPRRPPQQQSKPAGRGRRDDPSSPTRRARSPNPTARRSPAICSERTRTAKDMPICATSGGVGASFCADIRRCRSVRLRPAASRRWERQRQHRTEPTASHRAEWAGQQVTATGRRSVADRSPMAGCGLTLGPALLWPASAERADSGRSRQRVGAGLKICRRRSLRDRARRSGGGSTPRQRSPADTGGHWASTHCPTGHRARRRALLG